MQKKYFILDKWLFGSASLLLLMGILMVASASMVISDHQFGWPFHFFFHQGFFLIVGIVLSTIVLCIPIEQWQKISMTLLIAGLVLLVVVLIPGLGLKVNGSRRWLRLFVMNIQVSELVKLFVILYLSDYLVRHQEEVRSELIGFVKPLFLLSLIAVLLLLEPDFGATGVISAVVVGMLFLAGVRVRYFIPLVLLVTVVFALLAVLSPYRLERLIAFLNPWSSPFKNGYQLTQSLIAFGRGGIWGVGLGNSVQKLFYLPEAYTDFLFAVLGEELGLLGQCVVCSLFSVILIRALCIGHKAYRMRQFFSAYTAYGLGLWIALQSMVNMGVNLGILPTKGLTLPLMSYGGSSLLVSCIAIALLLRIYHELASA